MVVLMCRRLLSFCFLCAAFGPALASDLGAQTGRVLAGIIGYTRWPVEPVEYRLCTAGYLAYLPGNAAALQPLLDRKLNVYDVSALQAGWETGCDIIYMGALPVAMQRQVLKTVGGRPLLSVIEGDLECTAGSMFCLHVGDGELGMLANLDAISRAHVRISPKVLQLVRRRQDSAPEKQRPEQRATVRQTKP